LRSTQPTEASRQEWDGEMCISAQEYNNILYNFKNNFHFKVFSGVLQQAKIHTEIMQTKHNNISY
jgi:hypothetical protein